MGSRASAASRAARYVWPILAVAVAAGIFFSSSMPGEDSGEASMSIIAKMLEWFPSIPFGEDTLNFILRKGAHFTVYLILAFCVTHSLKYYSKGRRLAFLSWGIAAFYGVTDEIHQYFVPGRACTVSDMLINAAGAAAGTGLVLLWLLYRKRHIVEGSDSSNHENT
ncbi:MAG: VanZ family protein [Defluviitaleaceae bacterium]|nr:VanZ family protein [Defluviitaleaceae bacterium]